MARTASRGAGAEQRAGCSTKSYALPAAAVKSTLNECKRLDETAALSARRVAHHGSARPRPGSSATAASSPRIRRAPARTTRAVTRPRGRRASSRSTQAFCTRSMSTHGGRRQAYDFVLQRLASAPAPRLALRAIYVRRTTTEQPLTLPFDVRVSGTLRRRRRRWLGRRFCGESLKSFVWPTATFALGPLSQPGPNALASKRADARLGAAPRALCTCCCSRSAVEQADNAFSVGVRPGRSANLHPQLERLGGARGRSRTSTSRWRRRSAGPKAASSTATSTSPSSRCRSNASRAPTTLACPTIRT